MPCAIQEDERFDASRPDCTHADTNHRDALLLGRSITLAVSLALAVGAAVAFGFEYRARRRGLEEETVHVGLYRAPPSARLNKLVVHL